MGVLDVRGRTALRQYCVLQAVASNGWSSCTSATKPVDVGAFAVLGPIVGKVTSTTAVIMLEVDVRARVRCVLTNSFTGERYVE